MKLLERCFSCSLGRHFVPDVERFKSSRRGWGIGLQWGTGLIGYDIFPDSKTRFGIWLHSRKKKSSSFVCSPGGSATPHRWGSIAFTLPQLLPLETPLRALWDKEKFLDGSTEKENPVESNEHSELKGMSRIAIFDHAIRDGDWWLYLRTLDSLAKVIRDVIVWAEGCPCHSHLVCH